MPDITCGQKDIANKCESHSRPCGIVIDHSSPKKAAALERGREEVRALGHDEWIHSEDSEHYCNLCGIERKNGFPLGTLNDRVKAKYWVKKDRKERRRAKKQAKANAYQLPAKSPIVLTDAHELTNEEE